MSSKRSGNIFGINPKQPGAIQAIVKEVVRVLSDQNLTNSLIEIQIKYAQFKYFSPPRYNDYIAKFSSNNQKAILGPMVGLVQQQRYFLKDSLKKLSHQNMILLNDLGRRIYALNSCFDQQKYQKFYHMREYLIKQCEFNENIKRNNILVPEKPKNIYHQYSSIGDNIQFRMDAKSQIRFDIINKDDSSEFNGRFSYSNILKSWVKTKKKSLLKQQLDLMLTEKTFRFAINNEVQTDVSFQQLEGIKQQILKKKFKNIDIRLKRTLKCTKSNFIQYSLSQVYQPQKNSVNSILNFEDLPQFVTEDSNVLDDYLVKKFQHFYEPNKNESQGNATQSQTRYQIESQITQQGMKKLRNWVQKGHFRQIHYEMQQAIQSLYNLFFADHSVRTHEAVWMDKLIQDNIQKQKNKPQKQKNNYPTQVHNVYPNQRLVNQFGSYMHNIIFEQMTKLKNPDI